MKRPPVAACLVNIGPQGVSRRRRTAVVLLLVAVVGVAVLDALGVSFRWRALVIVPLWIAALCWLQAAAKT